MSTLSENITQAISDFDGIKAAIEGKGVAVPNGTPTSLYKGKIESIETAAPTPHYFGTKADGANVIISANTNFTSTMDGTWVLKQYGNLTINSGVTVSTSDPCCGLVILCDGTLTINGTLSMSKKASKIQLPDSPPVHKDLIPLPFPVGGLGGSSTTPRAWIGGFGAGGGIWYNNGDYGSWPGGNGQCYGENGLSVARNSTTARGAQTAATHTSAGGLYKVIPASTTGDSYYVANSKGYGGGGPGVMSYEKADITITGEYSGGCIIIVARKLIIGTTGKIECNGGSGGNGYNIGTNAATSAARGGGGGGGGVIMICSLEFTNLGTMVVDGGLKGSDAIGSKAEWITPVRTNGAVGTIIINKLAA